MKITPEMMAKFENCKSPEDVLELARQKNFSLTMEQAQKLFDVLQFENVTDEEMKKICGGGFDIQGNRIDSQNDMLSFFFLAKK